MPTVAVSLLVTLAVAAPEVYGPVQAPPSGPPDVHAQPDAYREYKRAESIGHVGLGFAAIGAATLLAVTLPARHLYRRALDEAADQPYVVTQDEPLAKARIRRAVMYGSLGLGAALIVTGTALAITGYGRRARIGRRAQLSLAPALAPGHVGAGATLRF